MTRSPRTRLAAAAAAVPLALGLAACGDSDGTTATSSSTSSSPSDDASTSAAATDSSSGGDAMLAAAKTGLAAVSGSTLFSVDRQDAGGWEVTVVTAAGTEYDVRVSADGASTQGKPVRDRDDGDDRVRDRDERQRLLGAKVDYLAALDAASDRASGGRPTGVDLDEERGQAQWEVQYDEDTADELTVLVDAGSGKVLRTERDD